MITNHMRQAAKPLQRLIKDQEQVVDARHEELREAYLEQQSTAVTLRRKVNEPQPYIVRGCCSVRPSIGKNC